MKKIILTLLSILILLPALLFTQAPYSLPSTYYNAFNSPSGRYDSLYYYIKCSIDTMYAHGDSVSAIKM